MDGRGAIGIVLLYAVFGGLWILFSDRLLALLSQSQSSEQWVRWQTLKGWIFIAVTASLLYVLIRRAITAIQEADRTKQKIEAKYRHLTESRMLGMATWKFSGEITDANDELLRLFGYTHQDLEAGRMRWSDLSPPEYHARGGQAMQELLARGLFTPFEQELVRKDGTRVPVLVGGVCTDPECQEGLSFVLDITNRKRAEEASTRRRKQLETLSHTSQQINAVLEKETILRTLVASAMELVDAAGGAAGMMLDGKAVFREYNRQGQLTPIDCVFEKGHGVPGWVMQTGKAYISNDAEHDEHVAPSICRTLGCRNLIDVPIHHRRGELLGCFELHNKEHGQPFDEIDQQMLEGLAASAAIALENAQMLQERAEAEAALKSAKELAEAANHAKDRFLATLSHELRTPLTPVLAQITALEKEARLPEDLGTELRMLRRNVELESRLIDDLLDLTRLTSGKLEMQRELVDVHGLLRHAVEICHGDVEAKGLQVAMTLEARQHHVTGDLGRLLQVFWNLIRNAIKFTPPSGRIEIRTRNQAATPSQAGQPPLLVVEVKDTGIGIDDTVMPRLFQAFSQGGAVTRQSGGLGLGLSISKAIVDSHDGKLTARSGGPGRGATFAVELAAVPGPEPTPQEAPPAIEEKPHPMRILLVEDNADTARVLGRLLRSMAHRVGIADRVETALQMVRADTYDLLISDIGLPDGTGLELMREIQRIRPTRGIAISGYGMEEDLRRSLAVGFAEHLIKPITLDGLEAAIARVAKD